MGGALCSGTSRPEEAERARFVTTDTESLAHD